jgi:drug/metabolite transporter (DMT)-like permease
LIRGLNHVTILFCTCLSFDYAGKANINKGVIASLYTSSIVFTSVVFRVVYGELISFKQACSMAAIMSGVICVGLGKPSASEQTVDIADYQFNVWVSIIFALTCGVCFSINAVIMKHYVGTVGLTPI